MKTFLLSKLIARHLGRLFHGTTVTIGAERRANHRCYVSSESSEPRTQLRVAELAFSALVGVKYL
jgi:hypothetical protein